MISDTSTRNRRSTEEAIVVGKTPEVGKVAKYREHHTILRTISNAPNGIDHFLAAEVDAYIASWLAAGWELVSVHLLSYEKDGAAFAWFLIR